MANDMTVLSHCQTEPQSQLDVKGFFFFLPPAAPVRNLHHQSKYGDY